MPEQINVAEPTVGDEEVERVEEVIRSGMYVSGENVEQFEEEFSSFVGTGHMAALNSGTAAIHLALEALGLGPGDEVIVPSLTFFSTATAALHQNVVPRFSDIDPDIYNMEPESVKEQITDSTKAIIPVHLYGHPCDMDPLMEIAEDHDLAVIEDCAQSHGAKYKGKVTGSIGDAGAFSFFATKNMTTGEGGGVTSDNKELIERIKKTRSHGMTDRNTHKFLGYNYRMTELSGAMGLAQMNRIERLNEKRSEYSRYLLKNLRDVSWLKMPTVKSWAEHSWFWFPVRVLEDKIGKDTLKVREELSEKGVETRFRYTEPLYNQPLLLNKNPYPKNFPYSSKFYREHIDYSEYNLENVERIAGTMIGLPNHPNMNYDQLDRVIEVVKSV
ncbi:MAG: DegT/DnrJ/EryC1/StrS family aminotransferase [Candidatus Nanohaloarchaea archaeon]|nr:DegT/DnrJ/EryC1/StrS family aminotransferase [Candidatus Nanohaloarchaea archaeon]